MLPVVIAASVPLRECRTANGNRMPSACGVRIKQSSGNFECCTMSGCNLRGHVSPGLGWTFLSSMPMCDRRRFMDKWMGSGSKRGPCARRTSGCGWRGLPKETPILPKETNLGFEPGELICGLSPGRSGNPTALHGSAEAGRDNVRFGRRFGVITRGMEADGMR